ncbi:MAG: hypothetical protein JSS56_16310 [Proteobacteria bacterium]|nr:hypothetical protein [Pseudomonadota bacterium]
MVQDPTGPAFNAAGASLGNVLPKHGVVVLVVDVVDSVDLMRRHEAGTVSRWAAFVKTARSHVLAHHHGEMVKSLGDGLMARFANVPDAVHAAAALHEYLARDNAALPADEHILLRAGINVTDAWSDGIDLYGSGVNVAARVATLAGPGETILTAEARDEVASGVDIECVDLGLCYLKSFGGGVRAYRAGPAGARPQVLARTAEAALHPTIAVIPFADRGQTGLSLTVGDLIADGVIDRLSRGSSIRVISRLSTAPFRNRPMDLGSLHAYLGATFVLSGGYALSGTKLLITAELSTVADAQVLWTERFTGSLDDLFEPDSHLARQLALGVHVAIFDHEMQHVSTQPLPTLASYSLLVGGINLMHRSNHGDFERARAILEQLIERHGGIAAPRTWLANWYVLGATRGIPGHGAVDADAALAASRSALVRDPTDAKALAIEGFVHCHLLHDLPLARQRCLQAIGIDANCALAWLYLGTINAFEGKGAEAVEATRRALDLSPIDPQRYYFMSLGATAELSAGNDARAEALARSSLVLNRMHSSTWRVLTIALVHQNRMDEARDALRQVLALEPDLSCTSYLARMPNGNLPTGQAWAKALAAAGLPD